MLPKMRWKFGRRASADYSCCFCCHIRMGTMFLGMFYLLLDLLAVTLLATLIIYPDLVQQESELISSYLGIDTGSNATLHAPANGTLWLIHNQLDCDTKVFGLIVAIGCTIFAVSLLYGVITGRARYLLPLFCLQVFDFCATSFSFVSYFSFEPEIRKWIAAQKLMPFKEELLSLSSDWLLILASIVAVVLIWIKGYCIVVIWSCHNYLVHCEAVSCARTINSDRCGELYEQPGQEGNHSEEQMVLPPKYEDIIHVPILSPAPPPYIAMETERPSV